MSNIIYLNSELDELKSFLPLNIRNPYFLVMFENMLLVENSDFYNNAIINITHFYNFILHCFLFQIYYVDENLELLKYLQKTTGILNSKDGSKKIDISKDFDIAYFSNIEKDAINYFLHIFKLDKSSHLCQKNQEIFDLRNSAAHLNMDIINHNRFEYFIAKVQENIEEIFEKVYKYTKKIIITELAKAIKKKRIDESSYVQIFEEINRNYYISINFYKLFFKNNKIDNPKTNSPNYYIKKYIKEYLQLEEK
ncbi:hypothetical protein [Candidatus Ruminimicrobium bovinum]|uniref:hypothetical protein n=1 Tax=Candidatus Ruminimicrobium bovinum TaxID=3242779 RepID=UPI0039B85098